MTDAKEPDDLTGSIVFYEFAEPPLESGDYTVTVKQHTRSSTAAPNAFDETFETKLRFAVQGVRFTIPPSYLHTQFPPPGSQGEFANVLAHVVFTARTLPWQRDPAPPKPDAAAAGPPVPWLALLTFDLDDPIPSLQTGTLASLAADLPPGTVSYPDLALDYGESWSDPVQFIDVPGELFTSIAPTLDDLRWLAHARTTDASAAGRKSRSGAAAPPSEFSVVISNRLAVPGHKTACYLVSVETLADYLPVRGGAAAAAVPQTIRLAVLSSWTFGAVDEPETFRTYFAKLNAFSTLNESNPEIATLQVPYANASGTPNATVRDALAMGYTAINHQTRQGAETVSWYRGPLLPYANPRYVNVPIDSADALVRYDPATGMFDESLAAAWQIGRLVALNDRSFATQLYIWKRGQSQQAVADLEWAFLAEQLGIDQDAIAAPGRPRRTQLMSGVLGPLLRAFLEKGR